MIREFRKPAPAKEIRPEEVELRLLLDGIYQLHGYDFRQYDLEKLRPRFAERMRREGLESLSQLQHRILRDRDCLQRLLADLIPRGRPMFDPPGFWLLLRRKIVPILRTYPSSRVWVAGCDGGEEAYALAVLLQEEGLGTRATVYATELDESALSRAREGRLEGDRLQAARRNYRQAGGRASFLRYGTRSGHGLLFERTLARRIVFASHSLATDSSFNEFNLIFCRTQLSMFSPELQVRACMLLHQSLGRFGFLALGANDAMDHPRFSGAYERVNARHHLLRRVR